MLIGSRAVAGTWNPDWLALKDRDGISLEEALAHFTGSLADPSSSSRAGDDIVAYLELHIEQGPVLEQKNAPIGVVSAISGARRFNLTLDGLAGHAGTVPMTMRRDALCGAAQAIILIEKIAQRSNVVATVGNIEALPGSVNVIPGRCRFTLDIRSGQDKIRDRTVKKILGELSSLAAKSGLQFSYEEFHRAGAVTCDASVQRYIEAAIMELDMEPWSLVSGAGHDAMAMKVIAPTGMIFLRCAGGLSHHPEESVTLDDTAWGIEVLFRSISNIISSKNAYDIL